MFKVEHNKVKQFLLRNDYSKHLSNKLVRKFIPGFDPLDKPITCDIPKVFVSFPYIGKQGELFVEQCTNKITKLIAKPVKFQINWQSIKFKNFTNTKDPIIKNTNHQLYINSNVQVVVLFILKKTDRNLLELLSTAKIATVKFINTFNILMVLDAFVIFLV